VWATHRTIELPNAEWFVAAWAGMNRSGAAGPEECHAQEKKE
jgi:hypothetical protein